MWKNALTLFNRNLNILSDKKSQYQYLKSTALETSAYHAYHTLTRWQAPEKAALLSLVLATWWEWVWVLHSHSDTWDTLDREPDQPLAPVSLSPRAVLLRSQQWKCRFSFSFKVSQVSLHMSSYQGGYLYLYGDFVFSSLVVLFFFYGVCSTLFSLASVLLYLTE